MGCVYSPFRRREIEEIQESAPAQGTRDPDPPPEIQKPIKKSSFRLSRREGSKKEKETKEYSWDKRSQINIKDYTIENVDQGEAGREPGTVQGQQFIIQNCKNANIYVFDNINTITIDDCVNCRIFLGPVKGSVFVRDCKDCVCIAACGQFRTRDCQKLDVFLCCATQPIIESSTGMHFGCYQCYYPELEDQFRNADLSAFNNAWSHVHDFTPVPGERNWILLPESARTEEYLPLPSSEQLSKVKLTLSPELSLVPYTFGPSKRISNEVCLVVFFSDGQQNQRSMSFINTMKTANSDAILVTSKEVAMQPSDAERVFRTNSYASVVGTGAVIGLEYSGPASIRTCQQVAVDIATSTGSTGLIYVSSTTKSATLQIENFFNYADMQM